MDLFTSLARVARLLIFEHDAPCAPEVLIQAVLEASGADRGFVVTCQDGVLEPHFDVCSDADLQGAEEPTLHRAMVERAIEEHQIIEAVDGSAFNEAPKPAKRMLLISPLEDQGTVFGVVYLEHHGGPPSPNERRFVAEVSRLAAPFLKDALEREARQSRPHDDNRDLLTRYDFGEIVTAHPSMMQLLSDVVQVAPSRTTVLVRGETGVGKELVARALHLNSDRKSKVFVPLHVSALQESVMEAELFGHVKGAFTGAERARQGRIANAHEGTLFLDEVAEIPLRVQAKLLRFIQFGEIQPVGSDRVDKVDVRVIAATHQNLGAMVQSGHFRQDLYFRLKVIELFIPPLRERASDIPLLVDVLMRRYWRRRGETHRFTRRAEKALRSYNYPGNVRELSNVIERVCLLARGPEIDVDIFPLEMRSTDAEWKAPGERFIDYTAEELSAARKVACAEVERTFVEGLMERHQGNVSLAARMAGLHRSYLQRLIARRKT